MHGSKNAHKNNFLNDSSGLANKRFTYSESVDIASIQYRN